jgi:hypothetical protein
MKVKGRRWKRARRHGLVRYFLEPLAWAAAIAAFAGAYFFFADLTGFRGRREGFTHRHSVAHAWAKVPLVVGMIFVIGFVVFVAYAVIRRLRRQD